MHGHRNNSNSSKQFASEINSINSSTKPNLLKQVFNTFENELLNIPTPLPTLKVKKPTVYRKFENEREKRNALAEAMQSQNFVAKVKKMYPNVSNTSFNNKNDRGWKHLINAPFVTPTPPIPAKYESKLHELDALIPQLKYEHRSRDKEAQKRGTKELNFQLDLTVPSQLLSPSFAVPNPNELTIGMKQNSNVKKTAAKETNEKTCLSSPKTKTKVKHLTPIFSFPLNPSPISSTQEGGSNHSPTLLKSNTPTNTLINPLEWLASHHPILQELPPSTTNPNIENLLSSFTQSVLKKCYLHEIHSTLPPHRIADASSKSSMERVIHHVLSGTQKDDVESLDTLLPINWDAKKLVMNSKADITHQWEATHQLIQTLNSVTEDQMIPKLIQHSRLKVPSSKQTKSLGNYFPGTTYVLERETKFDFDSNAFHSSMRNLASESDHARDFANLSYKAHMDKNDSSSTSSLIIGLHDEITDLEDFNWEIELKYTDEVQTFKSQVIRFLRELNEGTIDVKHLSNSNLNLTPNLISGDEVEPLTMKSKMMALERLCFPSEVPLPTQPDYQAILFTLALAMGFKFSSLSESAARLLCLITNCKIPSTTFHSCIFHLESSLSSGSLLQQWASAYFLVKLKVLDPVLEYMKKKLGHHSTPLDAYSPSLFLLQLSPHHFHRLATCLSPLLDHCSYHSRQAVVLILKQSGMVWREKLVHQDWLQVIGSHQVVISDEGEGLEMYPKRIYKEEWNTIKYPDIAPTYEPIHSIFRKIVQMMFEDWCLPLRDQCAEMVVDLDLLPLVMLQLNDMLLSREPLTQKKALRALASMKWISSVTWSAFLTCFSSDYLTIRVEACKTARSLGLCHSLIINELLKRCLDIEPRVRAQAIRVLPYVATSSLASHLVLRELLSCLSNELSILVKLQGAKALLQLAQRMQDKSTLNIEPINESQLDQTKALLTEWSTSELPEEKLLQKEAFHCLTHLIGGNTLLLRTTNEFKEQERMNQDKLKIIEKVRELSQRTQVLETLKKLTSQTQTSSSSSSSFPSSLSTGPFTRSSISISSISTSFNDETQNH